MWAASGSVLGRRTVSGEEERACFAASGESKMARMGRVGALEVLVVSYYFALLSD